MLSSMFDVKNAWDHEFTEFFHHSKECVSIVCVCVCVCVFGCFLRSMLFFAVIHKVSSFPEKYRHMSPYRLNLEMCTAILPLPYMTYVLTLLYRLMILFNQLKNYFYMCNYNLCGFSRIWWYTLDRGCRKLRKRVILIILIN